MQGKLSRFCFIYIESAVVAQSIRIGKTFVMVQKSAKLFSRVAFVIYGKFHALAVYVMYIICSYAFQIAYHPNNCVLLYKLLCSLSHLVPI